jgi:hypothetical protein
MFAAAGRQGSVRVNQELDAGPQGLKRVSPAEKLLFWGVPSNVVYSFFSWYQMKAKNV